MGAGQVEFPPMLPLDDKVVWDLMDTGQNGVLCRFNSPATPAPQASPILQILNGPADLIWPNLTSADYLYQAKRLIVLAVYTNWIMMAT